MKIEIEGTWTEIQEFCRQVDRLRRLDNKKNGLSELDKELIAIGREKGRGASVITCIKIHRNKTGASLKDSKDYVDALFARNGVV